MKVAKTVRLQQQDNDKNQNYLGKVIYNLSKIKDYNYNKKKLLFE